MDKLEEGTVFSSSEDRKYVESIHAIKAGRAREIQYAGIVMIGAKDYSRMNYELQLFKRLYFEKAEEGENEK